MQQLVVVPQPFAVLSPQLPEHVLVPELEPELVLVLVLVQMCLLESRTYPPMPSPRHSVPPTNNLQSPANHALCLARDKACSPLMAQHDLQQSR